MIRMIRCWRFWKHSPHRRKIDIGFVVECYCDGNLIKDDVTRAR